MGFNKDRLIVAQNSATGAATIVASLGLTDAVEAVEAFDAIRTHIFEGSLALSNGDIEGQDAPAPRSSGGSYKKSSGGGGQSNDAGAGVSLKFGKYAGKTIEDVYSTDPEYITWLADTSNNDFIKGKASEYLASLN